MYGRKYRVSLQTPIGRREGTLEVQTEGGRVRGYLDVLNHTEPFEGSIDGEGNCRIAGRLVTLMNVLPYTAAGRITPETLDLSLQCGRDTFHLTGAAIRET